MSQVTITLQGCAAMAQLWIIDSGASTTDIERGVAAAQAVFDRHHVDAGESSRASEKRAEDEPMSDEDARLAAVWDEADGAAVAACCVGWARVPESAHLECQG